MPAPLFTGVKDADLLLFFNILEPCLNFCANRTGNGAVVVDHGFGLGVMDYGVC